MEAFPIDSANHSHHTMLASNWQIDHLLQIAVLLENRLDFPDRNDL